MTNLDSILKTRDITLRTKVRLVKAMVFPVVMYGCKNWTVRKLNAEELWRWRSLLRVPWIARRSNQSILKEISPGCSLEGLTLKLKLQSFGHLIRRTDAFELWCRRRLLDCKEIQPVHSEGDQPWVFTGRTDVEAETPRLWPPDEEQTHLKRP